MQPPPLADWLESLLPLVFVIFFVVRQFLESLAAAKKDPEPVELDPIELPAADPQDEAVEVAPAPPRRAGAGRESEVDEFLRRLESQNEADPPPAPRRERPPAERPRRLATQARADNPGGMGSEEPARRRGGSEPATPEEAGGSSRRRKLRPGGAQPAAAESRDERIAARIHEKFDHKLGRLQSEASKETAAAVAPGAARDGQSDDKPVDQTTAEALAAMLGSPQGMRSAILANEILRPPTERW